MLLPDPGTGTNSAPNVNIDIFSYGGFPLLISYLALVVLAGIAVVKVVIRSKEYDKYFFPIATAWVCYQAQAIISINQIGLAVWGWALTGAVIGYEKLTRSHEVESTPDTSAKKVRRGSNQNQATTYLVSVAGFSVGVILAFPALLGDSNWRSSMNSGSLETVEKAANAWPKDSYRLASIAVLFEENKFPQQAYEVTNTLNEFNPAYFDGWRIKAGISQSTPEDRTKATKQMRLLDPRNTELK